MVRSGLGIAAGGASPPSLDLKRPGSDAAHPDEVQQLLLTSDGSALWSAGLYTLALWDPPSGALLGVLHDHPAAGERAMLAGGRR